MPAGTRTASEYNGGAPPPTGRFNWAVSKPPRATASPSIRLIRDALIDEPGVRWSRVQTDNYYLEPSELAAHRPHAQRFMTTGAYGIP